MSFVDPKEAEKSEPAPAPAKKEPLFVLMEQIIEAIQDKNAQTAHHLDRIATALEAISKTYSVTGRDSTFLQSGLASKIPVAPEKKPEVPAEKPAPVSSPAPSTSAIDRIKSAFPRELEDMLYFEDNGDYITVKPRAFLGSDNFAKIASIVRSIGGEYISAGKASCFKVYTKK